MSDYRNSQFCKELTDLSRKKEALLDELRKKHPRSNNHYQIVSNRKECYHRMFTEIFNCKCYYCGVSFPIIPITDFQVDHYIPKTDSVQSQLQNKNDIINLVLSCGTCNNNKSGFDISKITDLEEPDVNKIADFFVRDQNYFIQISEKHGNDEAVSEFYKRMKFGSQLKRLDYLLLELNGLIMHPKVTGNKELLLKFFQTKEKIQNKRNLQIG